MNRWILPLLTLPSLGLAQGAFQQLNHAAATTPQGSPESVRAQAGEKFAEASASPEAVQAPDAAPLAKPQAPKAPLAAPTGTSSQEAGEKPRQENTLTQANPNQPVIVIQNQNVNTNTANAEGSSKKKWSWLWSALVGGAVGAAVGGLAGGGIGVGPGFLLGGLVGLFVALWNNKD